MSKNDQPRINTVMYNGCDKNISFTESNQHVHDYPCYQKLEHATSENLNHDPDNPPSKWPNPEFNWELTEKGFWDSKINKISIAETEFEDPVSYLTSTQSELEIKVIKAPAEELTPIVQPTMKVFF